MRSSSRCQLLPCHKGMLGRSGAGRHAFGRDMGAVQWCLANHVAATSQHRLRLLATDNAADAYKALICLGARLPDADALLDAAWSLPWDSLMQPRQLAALRQASAQRMVQEQV